MTRTLLFLFLAVTLYPEYSRSADRPNILFILTDDQAWPTLGCYGGEHVPTPNLDSLAAEGIRFTEAYVMPQCTPTRAVLLTGQHTARNGMWHVIGTWYGYPWAPVLEPAFVQNLSRDAFTLAKGLREAGYATACLGKWHVTQNDDGRYLEQAAAPYYGFDWSPEPPSPDYHRTGDKGVDWLTDQTIEFITPWKNTTTLRSGRERDRHMKGGFACRAWCAGRNWSRRDRCARRRFT